MSKTYQLKQWTICSESNQIRSADSTVSIEPQAMSVLVVLLENRGKVVSRDQLITTAWKGAIVGDSSVNRTIAQLRKALGDDAKNPRLIETIPKRGYRLLENSEAQVSNRSSAHTKSVFAIKNLPKNARLHWFGVGSALLILIFLFTLAEEEAISTLSEIKKLTSEKGVEYDASFSRDGLFMVYRSKSASNKLERTFVKSIDSGLTWRLSHQAGSKIISPVFSPDSLSVTFILLREESCTINELTLDSIRNNLFIPKQLASCDAKLPPARIRWGHSGNDLLLAQKAAIEAPIQIVRYDMKTMAKTPLTFPPSASWGDLNFEVDPISGDIVFIRLSPYQQQLFILEKQAKKLSELSIEKWGIKSVSWVGKDQLLLSWPDRVIQQDVKTKKRQVILNDSNIEQVLIANNQNRYAVVKKQKHADLFAFDLRLRKPIILVDSDGLDKAPIHLDGRDKIAFVSDRSGMQQIWLADKDGSNQRPISQFKQMGNFMSLAWSPKTQGLIAWEANKHQIWSINIDTGEIEIIYESKQPIMFPTFSTSENRISFGSRQSGDWEIWSIDIKGNDLNRLTYSGGYFGKLDDLRQQLFFTKYHDKGVWKKQLLLNTTQLVINQEVREDYSWWQLVDDAIFIEGSYKEKRGIYQFSLVGELETMIAPIEQNSNRMFSLSSDMNRILYSRPQASEGNISLFELR